MRMVTHLILPLLMIAALAWGGCDRGAESEGTGAEALLTPSSLEQVDRHERAPVIVAFGDSLTAGLGVSAEEAYPARLQRRLDVLGYRYRVVNAGVSGDTTAGAVRRLNWVLKSRPDLAIVEFGGNDGLRGLDLAQTRANLEKVIEGLQSAGVRVVLAGMKLPPNYGVQYTRGFAAIYPELARKYQVTLIPFFLEGVAATASLNQADGIHPTAKGYEVIVDRILPMLTPLLEKAEQPGS